MHSQLQIKAALENTYSHPVGVIFVLERWTSEVRWEEKDET
jgi:hypothetical protein